MESTSNRFQPYYKVTIIGRLKNEKAKSPNRLPNVRLPEVLP